METWDLSISKESLLAVIDAANLDSREFPTCEYYSSQIGTIAFNEDHLKQSSNFLTRLCALRLSSERSDAQFYLPGTTWTELEYTDAQLDALCQTVEDIMNPELRSRIFDILWIRRRSVDHARNAAIAYINAADTCIKEGKPDAGERFARGLALAASINDHALLASLGSQIEETISKQSLPDFLVADSVDKLLSKRVFDPKILLEICQTRIAITDKPLAKQRFCTLAQRCATRAKKPADAKQALRDLASSYEEDADAAPKKVVAITHLKRAIQTLRQIPHTEPERERVHQKMLRIQQDLGSEFIATEVGSVDLTQNVYNARQRIGGRSKPDGLAELIMASHFHDAARARESAIKTIQSFPLQNMFAVEKFGSTHKSATAIPPAGFDEITDDRIFYSMITEYQCFFGVVASGTIVPMINELDLCHHITLADIAEFVYRSPVIPACHHEYFCLGILAGIQGRFVEAIHCIVPQLETLIRQMLHSEGVVVSGLDQKGNQRELDLNKLLDMPETEECLGKNIVTTLQIIFTHQAGSNIRNELAHGMLPSGACISPAAIYGWWAIVYLALHPVAQHVLDLESAKASQKGQATNE